MLQLTVTAGQPHVTSIGHNIVKNGLGENAVPIQMRTRAGWGSAAGEIIMNGEL